MPRRRKRKADALLRNRIPLRQQRIDLEEKKAKEKLDLVELDAYYEVGQDYDSLDESER